MDTRRQIIPGIEINAEENGLQEEGKEGTDYGSDKCRGRACPYPDGLQGRGKPYPYIYFSFHSTAL
jgi:hypothetical protein